MGIYKYLKTKNYNKNIITKGLYTQYRFFFFVLKDKKKILKTFSERVKTSQIQRIKSKMGHHISNHKGENSLCIHKCTKLTCTFPTLFFYSALITFVYLGWLLSALFAAIFKHLEPYLGKSEAQYTLSKRMNQT